MDRVGDGTGALFGDWNFLLSSEGRASRGELEAMKTRTARNMRKLVNTSNCGVVDAIDLLFSASSDLVTWPFHLHNWELFLRRSKRLLL